MIFINNLRKDIVLLMLSEEINDVEFDLKEVYIDEDADIFTASIYGIVDTLIFFWRFNLNENGFKIQGEKNYSQSEKLAFKKRVNKLFRKHSSEIRKIFLEGYEQGEDYSKVLNYVKETLFIDDNKIELIEIKE